LIARSCMSITRSKAKRMTFDIERLIRNEVRNLPVYSPGKSPEQVARELGISDCVKMASNENPLGPSPKAMQAMAEVLSTVNIYPDGESLALRKALSHKLGVSPECLIICHGVDEALDLMAYAFLDKDDEVVVGDPTFTSYELAAMTMGATVHRVPLKDYRQDIAGMLARVSDRTDMMMLCSPLNPTGTAVSRGELEEALEGLPEGVLLVFDEAYIEYATDPDLPDPLEFFGKYPGLVITRTFSKIYGLAGLRVGYAICSPEIRSALEKVKLPFNVNRLGQVAALAALADEEHVAQSRAANQRGKERIYGLLEELKLEYVPTEANFILVNNGKYAGLFERLLKQGVIVRAGEPLGIPGHVRITVGDEAQNDRLEEALRAIAAEG
jgi:histidinol-phosphate aminotransferase